MNAATPELLEPLRSDPAERMAGMGGLPAALPDRTGGLTVNTYGGILTSHKIVQPRDVSSVMKRLQVHANTFGDDYVYSWPVHDRKNKRTEIIEGPTIKLAMDLVREYGNCRIGQRVEDVGSHWIIYAQFLDLETGFGLERPFQQRKSQGTGMKDADRQADIVFQIGVSKATRNVIVNALRGFADYMIDEAKTGLLKKFESDDAKQKAHGFIDRVMERHNIAELRVTAVLGRARDKWTIRDLARVYMEMKGIHEGLTVVDEIYPTLEDARIVEREKSEKKDSGKSSSAEQKPAATEVQRTGRRRHAADPRELEGREPQAEGGGTDTARPRRRGISVWIGGLIYVDRRYS